MYTCMCIYMLYTKVVIYVVTDTGCIDMCVYRQTYTHTHILIKRITATKPN